MIFSGTSILGLIGRARTNILRVVLGPQIHRGPCGQKWLKMSKAKWNEIELRSFLFSPIDSSQ